MAKRQAIWVAIPKDIESEDGEAIVEPEPEVSEEGQNISKTAAFEPEFNLYSITGGSGQSKAMSDLLVSRGVDPRNAERVLVFRGRKALKLHQPQYVIRFT